LSSRIHYPATRLSAAAKFGYRTYFSHSVPGGLTPLKFFVEPSCDASFLF